MKVQLIFELPEETEAYENAMNGAKNKAVIEELWSQIFRPRYKHGYSDEKLNKLLENEQCVTLMDLLEEKFKEITCE